MRRGIVWLAATALALAPSGCATMRDTLARPVGAVRGVFAPRPEPEPETTSKPPVRRTAPAPRAAEPPAAPRPDGAPPAPAEPLVLVPSVEAGEAAELLAEARGRVERAASELDALDPATLDAEARVRLDMTRSLLAEARDAVEAGDAVRASDLAAKAEILASDLAEQ